MTATVNDGQAPNNILTRTFTVTVNACPGISNIPLQATPLDTPTAAVPFTVFDAETAASNLVVSASSRDTTLLPNANIQLSGTGTNRTIQLTPAGGRSGSTTVDLVVRDAHGAAWTNSFVFYVYDMVGRPTMDPLAAQVLNEDFGQYELNLTGISSGTNNPQSLRITAESSAPAIVPAPAVSYTSGQRHRAFDVQLAAGCLRHGYNYADARPASRGGQRLDAHLPAHGQRDQ